MILTGVALQNFRLHKNYFLKFTENTTVIIGENAIGKTSIIEAINLLATGNSFRAGRIEEMIEFGSELARVKGVVLDTNSKNLHDKAETQPTDEVEIILTRGIVSGKRTQHRLFSVNGVRRRKKDAVGKFFTVAFRPEDMRMIEGSPSRRRTFMDTVLSLLYLEYEVALKNYEQTVLRRNKLLQQVGEHKQPKTVLQYWDLNLVKYGEILQRYRQKFLESFASVPFPLEFSVEYDSSLISKERVDQYKEREIAAGHTLIGPHKDDIIVYLNSWRHGKDTKKMRIDVFGSRGQQRLAVLWLKFCELEYIKNKSNTATLLLLDDILSELDDDSKALALSVLKNYQSVVTTTEPAVLEDIRQATDTIEVIYL
ncbi:MAG: DNA replication and repair protein RecF [Patescibacteria group bacterium]|nr:MAG: DNA replication and repair protein RecF [Patescibacteria group bacterium]